ncbi:Crp/Fnr family transcriptional regulator [Palleronia sp. KMU-117]|uniref:Crp/Fnr family transcriptional regulator n=1 Tax=Palleronia sp. KMU-117 TaxID=3434108 RepID=UPI003D748B3D
MDRAEAEKRILRRGWLAAQAPALQSAVLKKARLVSYPAGDFLFHAGDDPGGIYGVVRGGVGIHVPSFTGEVLLSHVARTGVWFGYGPLMSGQSRTLTFSLLEATEVYHVPLAALDEIERTAPENARAIHAISDFGVAVSMSVVGTLQIRDPDRRIAATLLRVAPPAEDLSPGEPHEVLLTQTQLAELANAGRQQVNRALKRMEARGWLTASYGRIVFTDLGGVTAWLLD